MPELRLICHNLHHSLSCTEQRNKRIFHVQEHTSLNPWIFKVFILSLNDSVVIQSNLEKCLATNSFPMVYSGVLVRNTYVGKILLDRTDIAVLSFLKYIDKKQKKICRIIPQM